jgi:pyruvate formate lyase activating enzyme
MPLKGGLMHLGGLQKSSLIDYPGKVSCVFFLSGCNFDCPYCHNPGLVEWNLRCHSCPDEKAAYEFLETHKGFLDGVVISGGEATLNGNLIPFCQKIKQIGYPVKLDTNGSWPQVLKRLIGEGLVDYVAMDIKTDPLNYPPVIAKDYNPAPIFESIQTIMETAREYEFRTTCVKPIVTEDAFENIVRSIRGANLYVLQHFQNGMVLRPEYFRHNGHFKEEELMHLKSIAEPRVKRCIIR